MARRRMSAPPERKAGQHLHDLHDLLLIEHDAVSLLQAVLHQRVVVNDLRLALLAGDEVRDELHRARAVDGQKRDDMFERLHAERAAEILHAAGFQLEHRHRVAALEHLEGLRVVERNLHHVDVDAVILLDHVQRVFDDGQRPQPEEVHLQQPLLLARVGRERHDHAVGGAAGQRDEVVEPLVADDDARGVDAGLPVQPLEDLRELEHPRDVGIALDQRGELFRLLDRLVERHLRVLRDQLGQPVAEIEIMAEHAGDVLHNRLRLQQTVGADLGDAVETVAAAHVVDDFAAPFFTEVDIEVRRTHALGVQETFEEEVEPERIDVGDPRQVGDERPRAGAAPRTDRNVLVLRVADEVRHHEEIADEPGLFDDAELVIHAVDDLLLLVGQLVELARVEAVTVLHIVETDLAQVVAVRQAAVRHVELRIVVDLRNIVELHAAALGDEPGVRDRLGNLFEQLLHLLLGLEVVVGARKLEMLLGQARAGLDAEHDFMRLGVLLAHVVDVVGRDHPEIVAAGEIDQEPVAAPFLVHIVIHQLDEEVVGAEDVEIFVQRLFGPLLVALQIVLRNFAADAGARADQPLAVLSEQLLVDPRLVMEAVLVGGGHHLAEVPVALLVLAEQNQVETAAVERLVRIEVAPVAGGDIRFDADDRIDSRAGEDLVELLDAAHIAVVGDGHGRHVVLFGELDQSLDGAGAVEQTVMGVEVQVYEIRGH